MPKYINESLTGFGARLSQLRKDAGYTQKELADEIDSTRRVIAYYETESDHPPASLLVDLARALNVTTDELLGVKAVKKKIAKSDSRLQRRFQQIEKLPTKDRRQLIQVIDLLAFTQLAFDNHQEEVILNQQARQGLLIILSWVTQTLNH